MNITTIALVILGLVLVSAIVLSATALASVVILGAPHWNWVLPLAGFWLLAGIIATMRRSGVKRRGR
jgi:membrane protein implicated in regulation of membrane protease activity